MSGQIYHFREGSSDDRTKYRTVCTASKRWYWEIIYIPRNTLVLLIEPPQILRCRPILPADDNDDPLLDLETPQSPLPLDSTCMYAQCVSFVFLEIRISALFCFQWCTYTAINNTHVPHVDSPKMSPTPQEIESKIATLCMFKSTIVYYTFCSMSQVLYLIYIMYRSRCWTALDATEQEHRPSSSLSDKGLTEEGVDIVQRLY